MMKSIKAHFDVELCDLYRPNYYFGLFRRERVGNKIYVGINIDKLYLNYSKDRFYLK